MVVVAAGIRPNIDLAERSGFTVERAIVVDDHMRTIDDPDVYAVGECAQHRGQVYGLVAPLWEQAVVLADHLTGTDTAAAYHGPGPRPSSRWPASTSPSMGVQGARTRRRRAHRRSPNPSAASTRSLVIRDEQAHRRNAARRRRKVAFLMQAFDRGLPLPEERSGAAVRPRHPRRRRSAPPSWPTTRRSATATASARARWSPAWTSGVKSVAGVMDKTRAGKGCGSCKASGLPDRRMGGRRRRRGGPVGELVRPGRPDGQAGTDDGRSANAGLALGLLGVRRAGPGRRGGREIQDGAGVAAEDDVGRRVRRRARRPVHQRPGARQHPEGRHLLGGAADEGRRHHPGAAAQDRRRRREVRRPDGEADRRPAHRPARHQEGGPARRSGPTWTCRPGTPTARASAP